MKVEIFKTDFAIYFLHEEHNIIEQFWVNKEGKMSEEEYKADMLNYLKFVEKYKPSSVLINLLDFNFSIVPSLQEWVDKNIATRTIKILKNIAMIMPTDFVERLSVEQTMEEPETFESSLEINYFDNEQEAIQWLI